MSEHFIGMGRAPDGIDLPLGLSMGLAMHPRAAETFYQMTPEERYAAIRYVQSGTSGEEAKGLIATAISRLEEGHRRFS